MHDPDPREPAAERGARRCPACGTRLDNTGTGGDELLECPRCGLVMFDTSSR